MGLKQWAVRQLGGDFSSWLKVLEDSDGLIVREIVRSTLDRGAPKSSLEENRWLEEFYRVAQHRGCQVGGWKLRMLIYYYYGEARGEW